MYVSRSVGIGLEKSRWYVQVRRLELIQHTCSTKLMEAISVGDKTIDAH